MTCGDGGGSYGGVGFGQGTDTVGWEVSSSPGSGSGVRIRALTPVAGAAQPDFGSTPIRAEGPKLRDWSYLPGRRNRRRGMRRRIDYSDEGEITVVQETNKKKTGLRWKAKTPASMKFVDDNIILSKINMDSATVSALGDEKSKHDLQTQNVFRRVVRRA